MSTKYFPIKIYGNVVGQGQIHDDGTIELTMRAPSPFGKDIADMIEKGAAEGITISPTMTPASPSVVEFEERQTKFRKDTMYPGNCSI